MPSGNVILESHHVIENTIFRDHRLLKKLLGHGLIDKEVIARNIANSPGAIAARYELAHHRNGWAADGLPISPAVQQVLPDPDALTASDGQGYYRRAVCYA